MPLHGELPEADSADTESTYVRTRTPAESAPVAIAHFKAQFAPANGLGLKLRVQPRFALTLPLFNFCLSRHVRTSGRLFEALERHAEELQQP